MVGSTTVRGLSALDPLQVTLPHGCEVTLRRSVSIGTPRSP